MAEEFIWIVADKESQPVLPANSRDGRVRNPFDEPIELSTRPVRLVSAENLKAGMTEFLQVMGT